MKLEEVDNELTTSFQQPGEAVSDILTPAAPRSPHSHFSLFLSCSSGDEDVKDSQHTGPLVLHEEVTQDSGCNGGVACCPSAHDPPGQEEEPGILDKPAQDHDSGQTADSTGVRKWEEWSNVLVAMRKVVAKKD
ncbi:hypothetical protein A6R68_02298 [Neotoma lepida]|uniref:Uncharacterized protein n=1 Tax=Neotoma lepida TaxID=56216 RepID=A0A1A6GTD4_NEOLE|nr:hypothetical protein A6R68_02298 [Neotoma lepida]